LCPYGRFCNKKLVFLKYKRTKDITEKICFDIFIEKGQIQRKIEKMYKPYDSK
jgi:hypothetical protein